MTVVFDGKAMAVSEIARVARAWEEAALSDEARLKIERSHGLS